MRIPRTQRFVPGADKPQQPERCCETEGCDQPGVHKAPRSRAELREYYWFCLDHVREYNKQWNYFAGMNDDEVEHIVQRDTTWDRPTWPLGSRFLRDRARLSNDQILNAFKIFGEARARAARNGKAPRQDRPLTSAERKALRVMDLDFPVSLDRIKARYKELVKRHHPDANGGDRAAEERLKHINAAYTTLTKSVTS